MYKVSPTMSYSGNLVSEVEGSRRALSHTAQAVNALGQAFGQLSSVTAKIHAEETAEKNKLILEQEFAKGQLDVSSGKLASDLVITGSDPVVRARQLGQQAGLAKHSQLQYGTQLEQFLMTNPSATPEEYTAEADRLQKELILQSGMGDVAQANFVEYASQAKELGYRQIVKSQYQADSQKLLVDVTEVATNETIVMLQQVRDGNGPTIDVVKNNYFDKTQSLIDEGLMTEVDRYNKWKALEVDYAQEGIYNITDRLASNPQSGIEVSTTEGQATERYKSGLAQLEATRQPLEDSGRYTPEQIDQIINAGKGRLNTALATAKSTITKTTTTGNTLLKVNDRLTILQSSIDSRVPLDLTNSADKQAANFGLAKVVMGEEWMLAKVSSFEKDSDITEMTNDPEFRQQLIEALRPGENSKIGDIIKYSMSIGGIPAPVKSIITQGVSSTDPKVFIVSAAIYDAAQKASPMMVNTALSPEDTLAFREYNTLVNAGMSQTDAFARVRVNAEADQTIVNGRLADLKLEKGRTKMDTARRTAVGDFEGATSLPFGFGTGIDKAGLNDEYYRDFDTLYKQSYGITGDHDTAADWTIDTLSNRYGRTQVNGDKQTMMRFAPEKMYPNIASEHLLAIKDKAVQAAIKESPDLADAQFVVEATGKTKEDNLQYRIVAYYPTGMKVVNSNFRFQ